MKIKNPIGDQGVNGNPLKALAISFVTEIGDEQRAFIGTGGVSTGTPESGDIWEYNFNEDKLESKNALLDRYEARNRALSFGLDGKGIICLGYARERIEIDNGNLSAPTTRPLHNCWEYNPIPDQWNEIDGLEDKGTTSNFAVGFAVNNDGYILEGGFPNDEKPRIFKFQPK